MVIRRIISKTKLIAGRLTQINASKSSIEAYRLSKERAAILTDVVNDGSRAESILYFADEALADAQEYVLEHVQKNDIDQLELSCFYRAAIKYHEKILQAVKDGRNSGVRLAEIKRSEK